MGAHISPVRRFMYMIPLQKPKRRYRGFSLKQCNIGLFQSGSIAKSVILYGGKKQ